MAGKYLVVISMIILVIFSGCMVKETDANKSSEKVTTSKNIVKNTTNFTRDNVPPSPVSYLQSTRGPTWINWTWENPADKDLSRIMIYIDKKFKINISGKTNYYNLTKLTPQKQYYISIRAVDFSNNISPWFNSTTSTTATLKDEIPPDKIWYLEAETDKTWINWTWENPADKDYSYANIYLNGKFKVNLTKTKSYYNLTKLVPDTIGTISIRTVDSNKNVNPIWVNNTATTLSTAPLGTVTNLDAEVGRTWIHWTWDNPGDEDYNYVMVYIDEKFKVNLNKPKNDYNLTKLKNNTLHTIRLVTVDVYKTADTHSASDTRTTLN